MRIWLIVILAVLTWASATGQAVISGELRKWHRVTFTFNGPNTSETNIPNPFTDYRLNVTFTNESNTVVIPGYYAADGDAAETSADTGNKWRVHFAPPDTGTWVYTVSFRTGPYIAIDTSLLSGIPVAPLDGLTGSVFITGTNKTGRDHRAKGRLQYVGEHHFRYAENKDYFVKGGNNSPENLLAYHEFDGTFDDGGSSNTLNNGLHEYAAHVADWDSTDPSWQGGKGKGIIGALNYLASEELNTVYFLTMNITGDGDDVWPYISPDPADRQRFDVSKLDQWEIVFSHMDSLGLMLHIVLQERENQTLLDNGDLGIERKMYFRELIARFSHHLAITWNVGEENGYDFLNRGVQTDQQRKDMASFIKSQDPYKSFVTVHNYTDSLDVLYPPLLGDPNFDGISMQIYSQRVHNETIKYIDSSKASGKKWIVCHDETNGGVSENGGSNNHDLMRKQVLWGNLMAGGGGVEWYYGSEDLDAENFRNWSGIFEYTRHALAFFENYIPFWKMHHSDDLTSDFDDYCLADPGRTYAIYLPDGGSTNILDLPCGNYTVKWYDPRNGGGLQDGIVTNISSGSWVNTGNPPHTPTKDWVVLITNDLAIDVHATGISCGGGSDGIADLTVSGGTAPYQYAWSTGDSIEDVFTLSAGIHSVTITDNNGCSDSAEVEIPVAPQTRINIVSSICPGDSIFAEGAYQTTTGIYHDTILSVGCDSIIITNVIVLQEFATNVSVSICNGENYFAGGSFQSFSGTYYDTLVAVNGCDSIVTTELTVLPTFSTSHAVSICNGESYFAGGGLQTTSGSYIDVLTASNGCDSVVTTNLTVLPVFATPRSKIICEGESYFAGGNVQTSSGTYFDTLVAINGCDSVIITSLTVLPVFSSFKSVNICDGETFFAGGALQNTSGTYHDTLTAMNGCDSVITTFLTVLSTYTTPVSVTICQGENHFAGGNFQTASGTYYDTLGALNGCDSIIVTSLTVLPAFSTARSLSICDGDSYYVAGAFQTTSGIYSDTLTAANGCDSVIITSLTVLPTITTLESVAICDGESYFVGGEFQTATGVYFDTLSAVNGCDSMIITNLTVLSNFSTAVSIAICDGESYFAGEGFQTATGIYFDTLTAVTGCDSVIITSLTVLPTYSASESITICDGESHFAGGDFQTASGTYYDTLTATNGCDSVIITTLTVLPTFTTLESVTICDGESYFVGGALQTTTGTYFDTLRAVNGCDSIITTSLIVLPTFETSIFASICDGDNYLAGGNSQTISGIYYDTLTAANGCDSVIITDLTVSANYLTATSVSICNGEDYFVGGGLQTTSGTYYDTLTAVNGCDSVIATTLTILPVSSTNLSASTCQGQSYFVGGGFQTIPGTYYDTLSGANGCDSVIITELLVHDTSTTVIEIQIYEGDSYFTGGAEQTASGIYYDTLLSQHQCDSIIITKLNILNVYAHLNDITNTLTVRAAFEKSFIDNSYGANVVGWNEGRLFDHLINSDNLQMALFDANGDKKLDFMIDYISATSGVSSGFQSLGVTGGEGQMIIGDTGSVINTTTSINENFNTYGYVLTSNSPVTDSNYTPNVNYPEWIYDVWYEATIDLDAFGPPGFGYADVVNVHASPNKISSNIENISPMDCVKKITTDITICENEGYFVGGAFQTTPGTYYDTLSPTDSCRILVISNLAVLPAATSDIEIDICEGESYFAGGAFQLTSGTYYDTLTANNGCDSIIITNLNVLPVIETSTSAFICEGESYFVGGDLQTTSGTYSDTMTAINGCDSIILSSLTVLPGYLTPVSISICNRESYFVGGNFQTTSGTYYDTLTAQSGCDSVIVTNLTILPTYITSESVSICEGESYLAGGSMQSTSGIYYDTLAATNGCDSVITTILAVLPVSVTNRAVTICEGEKYFAGGTYQISPGIYYDTLAADNGCDSIIITDIAVLTNYSTSRSVSICEGEDYFVGGTLQTTADIYYDTLTAANGCDSVIVTTLTVLPASATAITAFICEGESYFAGGGLQTTSGIYQDTLLAANGCDSVLTTTLSVLPVPVSNISISICEGESYFTGGGFQNTAGVYYDTLIAENGCDSITITDLTVLAVYATNESVLICKGESYFTGGDYQTFSGTYYDTLTAGNGCDSVIITTLEVKDTFITRVNASICQGDSIYVQGAFQTESGLYHDTLLTIEGCDSIIITDLTVESVIHADRQVFICENDSFLVGGAYQTLAGIYYDTFATQGICDSVLITDLQFFETPVSNSSLEICHGDSVFLAGSYQKSAGIYQDTLSSIDGCDSVVITTLTLLPVSVSIIDTAVCKGESVFAQGNFQNSNGQYFDTLVADNGCDSIIITNLIVFPDFATSTAVLICKGDSYFVGGAFQTDPGIYYDTLIATNGCDSVIITNLIVLSTYLTTDSVSICDGESYYVGGAFQTTSGIYYDTLTATNGCDSVIATALTVLLNNSLVQSISICQGERYMAGGAFQITSGTYYDTLIAANGCDSVIITNLNVLPTYSTSHSVSICDGNSHFAGGDFQTTSGIYYDTLTAINGCDSVVATDLTVHNNYINLVPISLCQGDSIFLQGAYQTASGLYYDTLNTVDGCDSIIVSDLVVEATIHSYRDILLCDNDSFFVAGEFQTITGVYYDTFSIQGMCDSVVVTDLQFFETSITNISLSICEGDSIFLGGTFQSGEGVFYDSLLSIDGCDSIIITTLEILPAYLTIIDTTICKGQTVFAEGAFQNSTGQYFDTLNTVGGCDSIIITNLIVKPTYFYNRQINICQGESYFVGGAERSVTGVYRDTLAALNGCDSIIITKLEVHPNYSKLVPVSICSGESYFAGGALQTISGLYYDTLQTAANCDSVIITALSVLPEKTRIVSVAICADETHFAGGDFQNTAGLYYDTLVAANGCDSILVTNLTVLPTYLKTVTVSICDNETYFAGGGNRNVTGLYYDTLQAINGCDSVISTNLLVYPNLVSSVPVSICSNESYFAGGDFQTEEGVYYDTLMSFNGCDSVIITDLTVLPVGTTNISVTICNNDSYWAGGASQITSGIYYDTLFRNNGCDSIVITELTVLPTFATTNLINICEGETYFTAGDFQNTNGTYYDTLETSNGCDSVVITQLKVAPVYFDTVEVMICDNEAYFAGGALQSAPGIYLDSFVTNSGCDSIVATRLAVASTFEIPVSVAICEGESYLAGGSLQTTSDIYYDTLLTSGGCDSVIVTDLEVLPSSLTNVEIVLCQGDSLFVGGAYQTVSGIYEDTLIAANGCDSIILTSLNFLQPKITNLSVNICNMDSMLIGGEYVSANGTYYDTLNSSQGCDSILVIDLQVVTILSELVPVTICQGQSYFAGGAPRTNSGLYYDTIPAANTCDSVIITALSVMPNITKVHTASICEGDSYYAGGGFQTSGGIYFDTLLSSFSCDSVIITFLNVDNTPTVSRTVSICGGDSFFVQGDYQTVAGSYYDTFMMANGCDSIVITSLEVLPNYKAFVIVDICQGESYFVEGAWQTTSGLYNDTLMASNGCDSIVVTNLIVLPLKQMEQFVEICYNDSIYLQGAFRDSPGDYYDTLISANGCDSIILTHLTIAQTIITDIAVTICQGETYYAGGELQSREGIYYDTLTAAGGCDSIIATAISVSSSYTQNIQITICDHESYFAGGANQTLPGIYHDTLTAVNGCDSVVITDLIVYPNKFGNRFMQICAGESIQAGGDLQTATGVYYDTLTAANGCDSILITNLQVLPVLTSNVFMSICQEDSAWIGGEFHNTAGSYFDTLKSGNGCDSIIVTTLSIHPSPSPNAGANKSYICNGDSVIVAAAGGISFVWSNGKTSSSFLDSPTNTKLYVVTVTNSFGCQETDSVLVLVEQLPSVSISGLNATYCEVDPAVQLTVQPVGGILTGAGINAGWFDPVIAGAGVHSITYEYTNSMGCKNDTIREVTVFSNPSASFSGLSQQYCIDDETDTLIGLPSGGVYSGLGIIGNLFIPADAGQGEHQIIYSYTNSNGCNANDTLQTMVNLLPNIAFELADSNICTNGSPLILEATPEGGAFTGTGITDSVFDPNVAGVGGPYYLEYSYTDSLGCENIKSQSIYVHEPPVVNISGLNNYYCLNEGLISLQGLPAGGSFSGSGVNNNLLFIDSAGVGLHSIIYTYSDTNGCTSDIIEQYEIIDYPVVEISGLDSEYCIDNKIVRLLGSPSGGTFAGPGVIGNYFDPAQAGSGGPYDVVYAYADSLGCENADTQQVTVFSKPNLSMYGLDTVFCLKDRPVALIGVPTGGSFIGAGIDGQIFDPREAGPGSHVLVYYYNDVNGCSNHLKIKITVEVCSGIDRLEGVETLQVFPNPFSDRITIEINAKSTGMYTANMKDVVGKNVYQKEFEVKHGINLIDLFPASYLPAGTYLLDIKDGSASYTLKVIKY